MKRRKKWVRPSGCINCGRDCTVDCVDNHGNAYKGCAFCSFVKLTKGGD